MPPPSNAKQVKRMKEKLGKLNKEIRHSKKKYNNLISKRNSIKKKIEELKGFNPRLTPWNLSKLSIGLIGVIELMEEVESM